SSRQSPSWAPSAPTRRSSSGARCAGWERGSRARTGRSAMATSSPTLATPSSRSNTPTASSRPSRPCSSSPPSRSLSCGSVRTSPHGLLLDQCGIPRRASGPRRPHDHQQPRLGHRHDASRFGNRNLREQSPRGLSRPPAIVPGSAVPSHRGMSLLDEEMHHANCDESDQDERKPSRATIGDETCEKPAGEDGQGERGLHRGKEGRNALGCRAPIDEAAPVEEKARQVGRGNRRKRQKQDKKGRTVPPSRRQGGNKEEGPLHQTVHDRRRDIDRIELEDRAHSADEAASEDQAVSETVERQEGRGRPHDPRRIWPEEPPFEDEPTERAPEPEAHQEEQDRRGLALSAEEERLAGEDEPHRMGQSKKRDDPG